ncbi:MAG: hypothetical protein Kapaf2KO_09730 [Candidatus Kapaibacteriales bacterium]
MLDFKIHPWKDNLEVQEIETDGTKFALIIDRDGLTSQPIQMPLQVWRQLQFFNEPEINQKVLSGIYQLSIPLDQLRQVVFNLDLMGYLKSPRLETIVKQKKEYLDSSIKEPVCSGSVYSNNLEELDTYISNSLFHIEKQRLNLPRLILAPHLDYNTGQKTIEAYANAFSPLKGHANSYKKILMLGTAHYIDSNLIMLCDKNYLTPYGEAKVNRKLTNMLSQEDPSVSIDNLAHRNEHSLELHLPFLQHIFRNQEVEYLFALTGDISSDIDCSASASERLKKTINSLKNIIDDDTLVVASGDLTHIGHKFGDERSSAQMRSENENYIDSLNSSLSIGSASEWANAIKSMNNSFRVCGYSPFFIALSLFDNLQVEQSSQPHIWEETSTGSSVSVVGYSYS